MRIIRDNHAIPRVYNPEQDALFEMNEIDKRLKMMVVESDNK